MPLPLPSTCPRGFPLSSPNECLPKTPNARSLFPEKTSRIPVNHNDQLTEGGVSQSASRCVPQNPSIHSDFKEQKIKQKKTHDYVVLRAEQCFHFADQFIPAREAYPQSFSQPPWPPSSRLAPSTSRTRWRAQAGLREGASRQTRDAQHQQQAG